MFYFTSFRPEKQFSVRKDLLLPGSGQISHDGSFYKAGADACIDLDRIADILNK